MASFLVHVGVIVAAVLGCGAWLRWAVRPALIAAAFGVRLERQRQRHAGRHAARLLRLAT